MSNETKVLGSNPVNPGFVIGQNANDTPNQDSLNQGAHSNPEVDAYTDIDSYPGEDDIMVEEFDLSMLDNL